MKVQYVNFYFRAMHIGCMREKPSVAWKESCVSTGAGKPETHV